MPPSRWDLAEQKGYDRRDRWKERFSLIAFWILWGLFVLACLLWLVSSAND